MKNSLTCFLSILLFSFSIFTPVSGQIDDLHPHHDPHSEEIEFCATSHINDNQAWNETLSNLMENLATKEDKSNLEKAAVITIPVVFHVIHSGEPVGVGKNISLAQLQSQLDVLNEDFRKLNTDIGNVVPQFAPIAADIEVEFCLAIQDPQGNPTTGVNRYNFNMGAWGWQNFEAVVKPATFWNPNHYLNFWVADISLSGFLGWARYPGGAPQMDGVVNDYTVTGRAPQNPFGAVHNYFYDKGRIGTHEVGHWLGLQHTFDNGCGNLLYCFATGDNICDTPPKYGPSFGCNPLVLNTMQCGYLSNVQNHMDYTSDPCRLMFTQGQKTAMRAVLSGIRSSILSSPGCQALCATPTNLNATNVTNNTATLNWGAVAGANSYTVQYRKFAGGPFPWTTINVNINSANIANLTAFTPYEFRVQANCNNGTSVWSTPFLFWTLTNTWNCGNDVYENIVFYPPMQNNAPVFGLICPVGDVDFQVVNNQIPNATINLLLDQLPADYDLELKDNSGNTLAGSYNVGNQNETITYTNLQPGIYYPTIFGKPGQFHATAYFRLTMFITPPGMNAASQAKKNDFSNDLNEDEIVIFPNPNQGDFSIKLNGENSDHAIVQLIDLRGSLVYVKDFSLTRGTNLLELNLPDFESGSYFLKITTGDKEHVAQMVIVR